ncbi:unnamed protein product [Caenorhabditis sp. 36 PRJEB53466]|nr:unnamed protein product [Caenorhabditis sp. 36 PRJEB53466]
MRIIIAIILLAVCSVVDSANISALREIYEDFAILTRVANAISLQAAALEKNAMIREVIAELLRTNTDVLIELIRVDPQVILRNVQREYASVVPFVAKIGAADRRTLREMNVLNEKIWAQTIEDKSQAIDGSRAHEFYRTVVNNETASEVALVCAAGLVTDMQNFYEALIEPNKTVLEETKRDGYLKIIQRKSSGLEVHKCLENIRTYSDEVQKRFLDAAAVLKEFEATINTARWFSDNSARFETLPTLLDDVDRVFGQTADIWKTKRTISVGALLEKTSKQFVHRVRKAAVQYTAGFPDPGDIGKIGVDLKSDWFKEKVSGGKSTQKLEKTLAPFMDFGRRMNVVQSNWHVFEREMSKAQKQIDDITRPLKTVELFQGEQHSQTLANAKNVWRRCWNGGEKRANSTSMDEARRRLNQPLHLMKTVQNLRKWQKKLVDGVDLTAVEDVFNMIGQLADGESWDYNRELIRRLEHYEELEKFLYALEPLAKLQTLYKSQLRLVKQVSPDPSRLDLNAIYAQTKLKADLDCLAEKEKGFGVHMVMDIIEFLNSVFALAEHQNLAEIKMVLEDFETFRKSLLEMEKYVKGISGGTTFDPILRLNNSLELTNRLGKAMIVLRQLTNAQENRPVLEAAKSYSEKVSETLLRGHKLSPAAEFFYLQQREAAIDGLLHDLELIEQFAASRVRGKDLMEMRALFDEVKRIHGFPSFQYYREIHRQLRSYRTIAGLQDATENSRILSGWVLNFADYKGDLSAAALSIGEIKDYFDDIFGLKPNPQLEIRIIDRTFSVLGVVGVCIGAFLLLIIVLIIGYGFTKNGRKRYRMWYLYYFPNMDEFERRWRYSLFMDRTDMKNALIDAVHDTNAVNVGKAIRRGVYINVRNSNGKTALHIASENGYPDMVRMLIKAGADRTMLSTENKTAEQMVPAADSATFRTKSDKFEQVLRVYEKCRKKKYRLKVPDVFPVSSFHIYMHPETSNEASDRFFDAFPSIATNEALDTMTHCVVRTDADGVLETDDVSLLASIFNGTIIVSEQWMVDCVRDGRLIKHDDKYLVERVKYKGHVYENAVLPWSRAMAKGDVPFLLGAHVALVMKDCPKILDFYKIIKTHGGEVSETFPAKADFNRHSHPYLHADKGPLFIIHDNQFELGPYHNDPDRMYTLFTEPEFIVFLLKRDIQRDTSPNPIPVKISDE